MRKQSVTIWLMVGVLCMSSSQVMGWIQYNDGGTYDINTTIDDDVWVDFQTPGMYTTVNLLTGGAIGSSYDLQAHEDSIINVSGGLISDNLYAYDNSQVNLFSGSIGNDLYAYDNSQVNISGGSIDGSVDTEYCHVDIFGGSISRSVYAYDNQVNISGGFIGREAYADGNYGQIDISGGSIGGVRAHGKGHVNIFSGSIGAVRTSYHGNVDIFGGSIDSDLLLSESSILSIYGSDFAIDDIPVDYGNITSILGGNYLNEPSRTLTGILASGELLDSNFYIGHDASIILNPVPEPATLLLLGIGSFFLRRKR